MNHRARRRGLAITTVIGLALALAVTLTAPVGAQDAEPEAPTTWFVDETKLPFDALPGAEAYWGVLRGAGYRIEVPENWNGDLVVWAHGFRGEGLELTVDNHPIREHLIEQGFAWAASSYTRNSYDVEAGMIDSRRLAKFFGRITGAGRQTHTYLTGASMGGHITAASIEQWPGYYDGAMPICGAVGDFELFDYFLDITMVGLELGVGAGSSTFPVDPVQFLGADVPAMKAAFEAAPGAFPFALSATGQTYKQAIEVLSGGDRPNFDEAFGFWYASDFMFSLGLGDGTLPGRNGRVVDNTDAVYQLDLDPALSDAEVALNADVERVESSRFAREYRGFKNVRPVTGRFKVPVVSLHNLGDLFVPYLNQLDYLADAERRGSADLLVQRAIRGVGHCDFTQAELTTAFDDLVGWVEDGVKPAGDSMDPAAIASPDYGCAFTDDPDGEHLFATPCPQG